jgi:hypothetical protein
MRVKIYKLRRGAADWVIDEKHPVAEVTVQDGQGSFRFYKNWEKSLRELFTKPASAFRGGGKPPDGACFDAFVTYPAWTREAIELIVSDILRGYTLGGRIIDDEVSATRPSFTSRRRQVLPGCAIGLALCCLALALSVAAGAWYRASMISRVEKAVRASFPDFCHQEGERITVQTSALPRSLLVYRYWDVACTSSAWITGPAMTVDAPACAVFAPPYGIPECFQSYGGMFKDGQRMAMCPQDLESGVKGLCAPRMRLRYCF